jgi:hypothetical protein
LYHKGGKSFMKYLQIIAAHVELAKGTLVGLNEDSLSFRQGCYAAVEDSANKAGFQTVELLHNLDFKQGEVIGLDEAHAKAFVSTTIPFDSTPVKASKAEGGADKPAKPPEGASQENGTDATGATEGGADKPAKPPEGASQEKDAKPATGANPFKNNGKPQQAGN